MTDFNQALSVAEAVSIGCALDGEDVYWIEEPVRHDDYEGTARIAREIVTPIQSNPVKIQASTKVTVSAIPARVVR